MADVVDFVIDVNGTKKVRVLVTVTSECRETDDGCQVTYTVANDASADTNIAALSVGGHLYVFDIATAHEILPGQVGTVTVTRPGAECKVTSEGVLIVDFPALGAGGAEYGGICVCTLTKPCDREDAD
jgi:hypothetical protein